MIDINEQEYRVEGDKGEKKYCQQAAEYRPVLMSTSHVQTLVILAKRYKPDSICCLGYEPVTALFTDLMSDSALFHLL